MIGRKLLVVFLLYCFNTLFAQLPQTAMYLLYIDNPDDTAWTLSKIEYISSFNPKGYNNQPCFISPTSLLASIRPFNGDNNDIYQFDFNKKSYTNITNSASSEYSPRMSPNNSTFMNCVSVPKEDTTIQNLVEINIKSGAYSNVIFNKFAKIGYYRHIKDKSWACYLVDEPHVLSICDANLLSKKIFASSIGRSFEVINQKEILFVHKITENHWVLKAYNLVTEKSRALTQMPVGTEDFELDENGSVICASDSKLMKLSKDGRWQTLIDLKPLGIKNINRLAINKNRLVVVSVIKS